jgi:hypothetical protein
MASTRKTSSPSKTSTSARSSSRSKQATPERDDEGRFVSDDEDSEGHHQMSGGRGSSSRSLSSRDDENYAEENDVCWVDIQMIQWRSFWKRTYVAIKYIFGHEEKYGHWDCTQLSRDEVEKLKKFLDRAILNLDEKNNS